MPSTDNLYKLSFHDAEKASLVLRDAFINYPTFKYLFPDVQKRKQKLRYVMLFFIKCGLLQGEAYAPSKNLEGISIWYKSGELPINFNSLLKAGLVSTIFHLKPKSFLRMKKLGDAKKTNRDAILHTKYYFLDVIGVNPLHAKQGFATLLMNSLIAKAEYEGTRCMLETSSENNMDYYAKYGFMPIRKYNYDGLDSYYMMRDSTKTKM